MFPRARGYNSHLLFDHFQFALIHGPDIPGSYAILLFTASDLASITSHIHSWVLFLLWLHSFILSGVISPLISSIILGTYQPREFLFQYPIILPFHAVRGVLKARILKWFAIPFSSGPHSVRADILECEVKWALESITMNKASGGDGIPVELFQILKDDAVKMLHSICQQIWKTQQWPQDWKRSVFIPIPKKAMPKNVQTTA